MRLCINMLIFTHNLGNWLITSAQEATHHQRSTSTVNGARHKINK